MKKAILAVCTVAILAYCVGVGVTPAHAWCKHVCGEVESRIIQKGDSWFDMDGILHVRNQVVEWTCHDGGCFGGSGFGLYNIDINLATGDGSVKGHQALDLIYCDILGVQGPCAGTFVGTMTGNYDNFFLDGRLEMVGRGGFADSLLMVDVKTHYTNSSLLFDGLYRSTLSDKAATESTSWSNVKCLYR